MKKLTSLVYLSFAIACISGSFLLGRNVGTKSNPSAKVLSFVRNNDISYYTVSTVTSYAKRYVYPGEEVTFTWYEKDEGGEIVPTGEESIFYFQAAGDAIRTKT